MADKAPTTTIWTKTLVARPKAGQKATRGRQIVADDIVVFTKMTGDKNPLHYDEVFAEQSVFGRIIVQGGVTSGILNAVVAEDLPGPGTVFLSVEWQFRKAVGVGETIEGEVEVLEVRDDKPICVLRTIVRNGAGEICLEGKATTYTVLASDEAVLASSVAATLRQDEASPHSVATSPNPNQVCVARATR